MELVNVVGFFSVVGVFAVVDDVFAGCVFAAAANIALFLFIYIIAFSFFLFDLNV